MAKILSLLLLFVQQPQPWPQSNPFVELNRREWQQAYRDFKPGARIAAELQRLEDQQQELFELLLFDLIGMEQWSVEQQRYELHRHLLRCVALVAAPRDDTPQLVVVQSNRDEIRRVFPSGKLPAEQLQPNHIYETEPGSRQRVRYLTVFRWMQDGPRFVVFTREPER